MKVAPAVKCIIDNCDNTLSPNHRLPECQQCRGMFRYWYKKSPTQVIDRQRALKKWQSRMRHLVVKPKGRKHAKAVKAMD